MHGLTAFFSVPTLCVGMPSSTLRVVRAVAEGPQSGQDGIPTQSVGTSLTRLA